MPSLPPRGSVLPELDDFVPRAELGRGGMAIVELAEQRSLGRDVALKRPLRAGPEAELALLHEAVITGQLEHPNIVPVHGIVRGPSGPAVVLKRVTGESLDRMLARNGLSLEGKLDVFADVCQAIAFAHSRDVLHLDLKPSNVMVGGFGEVYVMDWGLARRVGDPREAHPLGTPCYMAPEATRGEFSRATDVFLLGALLHELLTGRPPYDLDDPLEALAEASRCPGLDLPLDLPSDLRAVVTRACAKSPCDRYPSATELREAVASHRERRAALRLLARARERVASGDALVPASSPEAQAADAGRFAAARLAYEQALELAPDLDEARDELRALVQTRIEQELASGHDEAALALAASAPDLPPTYIADVRRRAEGLANGRERLSVLARDVDPDVGAEARARAFGAFATAVGLFVLALLLHRAGVRDSEPSTRRLAIVGTVVLALLAVPVGAWLLRRRPNLANRRLALLAIAILVASCLHRWSAVLLGTAASDVLVADAYLLALGGAALAAHHWAGAVLGLLSVGVAAVGTVYPSLVDEAFTAVTVGVPLFTLASRPRARSGDG